MVWGWPSTWRTKLSLVRSWTRAPFLSWTTTGMLTRRASTLSVGAVAAGGCANRGAALAAVRSNSAAKREGRRIRMGLMTITIDGNGGERLLRGGKFSWSRGVDRAYAGGEARLPGRTSMRDALAWGRFSGQGRPCRPNRLAYQRPDGKQ